MIKDQIFLSLKRGSQFSKPSSNPVLDVLSFLICCIK
ncbi:hypothetical protein NC651_039046 [Populus alba x Populus x berolinensis]|nr:hypothetical protein NC651_039046 [Populus alba x Populus x berolinensis]